MRRTLFTAVVAGTLALFMITACADDGKDTEASAEPVAATVESAAETADATEEAVGSSEQSVSIMDQPVDFSTPENVEKSLQLVREQESEAAYKRVKSSMGYVSYYDLSIGGDKNKLYKKLNGLTPNEIIAKAQR